VLRRSWIGSDGRTVLDVEEVGAAETLVAPCVPGVECDGLDFGFDVGVFGFVVDGDGARDVRGVLPGLSLTEGRRSAAARTGPRRSSQRLKPAVALPMR
jgi:hypothetical protein